MDNPGYISLTRMKGLTDELRAIANNIANSATTGFRGESLVFAEVLEAAEVDGGAIAMSAPRAHITDPRQGGMTDTGGTFDVAINGEGFFQVMSPNGPRLTRSGAFATDAEGGLVTMQGYQVLDAGGGPIQLPPNARSIMIGEDGSVSADGALVGQVGLFDAAPGQLLREDGVNFRFDGEVEPAADSTIRQGFLEQSNVNAVDQMARLIEVQRAYELGQSFVTMEDERQRESVRTLGRLG